MKVHEPGRCFDPTYGNPWCTGEATYGPDPYQEDVNGDSTPAWLCPGVRDGRLADI